MHQPSPAYTAPWWLPGRHAQTIFPLARKGPLPPYRRERVATPDGDFIDLDWLDSYPVADINRPLIILFHGLEGSSRSHYARSLMRTVAARGWDGVVVHFRGCSGEPNRLLRAYHSGDSDEIDWVVRHFARTRPDQALFAAGVSLGANALLKWLGEREHEASHLLRAAAAICAPLDLRLSGNALDRGFNRLYSLHFLTTLKAKAAHKANRFPDRIDLARVQAARTLRAFDDAYTAPVHGFRDADDYWRKASSKPWLRGILVPTLLLNAGNDSFVPSAALPAPRELSPHVVFECPQDGGHVGFLTGSWPGRTDWLPHRVLQMFAHYL